MSWSFLKNIKTGRSQHIQKQVMPEGPGKKGTGCVVDPLAMFKGHTAQIHLGDRVRVKAYSLFECNQPEASIVLGDDCHIEPYAVLMAYGGFIKLGHHCSINPFCVLYGHGGLTIGNYVRIAAHTVIIPSNHVFDDPDAPITEQGSVQKGIVIDDDVWIGAGVRILDGCHIGKGSVIGAGTVVTRNVEPYSIVAGVPGKIIGTRHKANQDNNQ